MPKICMTPTKILEFVWNLFRTFAAWRVRFGMSCLGMSFYFFLLWGTSMFLDSEQVKIAFQTKPLRVIQILYMVRMLDTKKLNHLFEAQCDMIFNKKCLDNLSDHFKMQDSHHHQLRTKQHFLPSPSRAVACRFCGSLPHHSQLQHQLHHLLCSWLKLQKGLAPVLWAY